MREKNRYSIVAIIIKYFPQVSNYTLREWNLDRRNQIEALKLSIRFICDEN